MAGIVKIELTGEGQQAVQTLDAAGQAVERIAHKGGEAKSALVELKEEAHHLSAAFVSVERIAVHFFAVFEAGKKVIELGAEAWELYHAKMEAALSGAEARDHARDLAHAISRQIAELRETGKITGTEAIQLSSELALAREREGKGLHDLAQKLIALNPHKKETELLLAEVQTRKQALEIEFSNKEHLGMLDLDRINDFTKQRLGLADEEHGLEVQIIREKAKSQEEADLAVKISAEKLKQEKNKIYQEQTVAAQKFVADEAQTRSDAEEEMTKALIDQAQAWEDVRRGEEERARFERQQAEERRRIGREEQLLLLQNMQLQQKAVETDPEKSAIQKRQELRPLFEKENELIQQQMLLRAAEAQDPNLNPEDRLKSAREEVALQDRLLEIHARIHQIDAESSFTGSMAAGLQQLSDAWENLGHNVANVALDAIQTAVHGVTEAIMGVIEGTRTWGQVFLQVGRQILATIIQVVLQWIVSMTLLKALKAIFHATDNVEAASSAAAWAPAAIAASIASYGAAATIGTTAAVSGIAVGSSIVAGLAAGLGAFATGGVVRGGEQLIRVNERGTEAILNAQALANVGEGFVSALNAGLPIQQAAAVSSPTSIKNNQQVNVLVYDDKARMNEYLQSAEGSSVVVDLMRKNLHNITGRT